MRSLARGVLIVALTVLVPVIPIAADPVLHKFSYWDACCEPYTEEPDAGG